jgi:hypothetical protein
LFFQTFPIADISHSNHNTGNCSLRIAKWSRP